MELKWFLAVCVTVVVTVACSSAATTKDPSDRIGLVRPTDEPITISDIDIDSLINSVFYASTSSSHQPETLPTPAPQADGGVGREEENNVNVTPGDCECVPYYLCNTNRTVILNGEGLIDIRMKEGPCESYMDVCCKMEQKRDPSDPITPTPPPIPVPFVDTCGKRNFGGVSSLRITGAQENEAQFGEFPWMVAIIQRVDIGSGKTLNMYQCGGSLISKQVVLTAAHCVKGKENLRVRAGEWDTQLKTEPLPTQNRLVREVVVHEEYYAGALYNDVALLFLESPVDSAANVATVCLPQQGESMEGRDCVATGWGKDVFGKDGKYQVILKKVELPIVSRKPCQDALRTTRVGKNFQLHSSFLCAGGIEGRDTCKGDGGSPLVCPTAGNPAVYVQAGIVAWGIGCGSTIPGVYADVTQFRDWIDSKISIFDIDIKLHVHLNEKHLSDSPAVKTVRKTGGVHKTTLKDVTDHENKVVGWGLTSENGKASETLLHNDFSIMDYKTCHGKVISKELLTYDKFCGAKNSGSVTQKGDRGGGVTTVYNQQHYVIGIVSSKFSNDLSLFINLSLTTHRSWIETSIEKFDKLII